MLSILGESLLMSGTQVTNTTEVQELGRPGCIQVRMLSKGRRRIIQLGDNEAVANMEKAW
jgi:hypothetical protein